MTDFADLGLSPDLLKSVADLGYTTPTPIQEQAIPHVLQGRDVLGCAQTGTGKTASFTLPMIDILANGRARARMPRTLILEPTRELAAQVAAAFELYGKNHKLTMALVIGGESMAEQERKLDRGVHVLIATPGRLIDLFERGKILLSDIKILVIDEADRMLDMGFIPDIERIVGLLPSSRQTLFFSATMPPEIRRLADAFLTNPKEITVAPPASTAVTVAQHTIRLHMEEKRRALRHLLQSEDVKNAIIFCNRKRDVDILYKSLQRHGFDVVSLHGDMMQSKRTETLEKFRNNEARLLVASDVAARGIDIQGLSHVFNFDVPIHAEDYVHRIGRTGRAGNLGRAFTFVMPDEGKALVAIEKLIGQEIPLMSLEGFEHPEPEPDAVRGRGRGRTRGRARPEPAARPVAAPALPQPLPVLVDPAHQPQPDLPPMAFGPIRPERAQRPAGERDRADRQGGRKTRGHRDYGHGRDLPREEPIRMGYQGQAPAAPFPEAPRPFMRRRDEDDDDERVIGFGDHTPAFLTRPTRMARRS